MTLPKVSILLPVVDEWPELARALRSVYIQDYPDLEIVIRIDGGLKPPDLSEFTDPRIKWMTGPRKGLAQSLNEMAGQASGPILMRLDADDEMLAGRVQAQVDCWLKQPGSLVTGQAEIIEPGGQIFSRGVCLDSYFRFRLLTGNPIAHSSVAMDAFHFDEIGGYNSEWDVAQDYELWVRWVSTYAVTHCDQLVSRCYIKVDEDKTKRQNKRVAALVAENVVPYLGELNEDRVGDLTSFSAGSGEVNRLPQAARDYYHLARQYAITLDDSTSFRSRFLSEWPFILNRNLNRSDPSLSEKIALVWTFPMAFKGLHGMDLVRA